MPIRSRWIFLFLFYFAVLLSEAKSQQQYDIAIKFDHDTIPIAVSKSFANKLRITNHSDKIIELKPSANNTSALQGLIKLPHSITLMAKESKSFPLKYMADRRTIAKGTQTFTIGFQSNDPTVKIQPPQSFSTRLNEAQSLLLQTELPEYYIDQSTGQVQFLVRAVNIGLVPLTIQVRFPNLPGELEIRGETLPVTLAAGGQSLLSFTATMRSKKTAIDVDFTLEAVEAGGKVVANNRVRMMTVGSVKRFGADLNLQNLPYNNMLALRYLNMGQDMSVYQVQLFGEMDMPKGRKLTYRLNTDYYQKQKALNMYDTYIDYQTKDWGVKIGNIYENLDQPINGRGAKASYKLDKERSISLYAVENSYMLINQMNSLLSRGKIIGAKYTFRSDRPQENSVSYLHTNNDYRAVNSDLISGKGVMKLGAKQQLGVEGGYSVERLQKGGAKMAAALGFNYNYADEHYQISSINYYSTPYYVGLRRGLIQSDTRISKLLKKNKSVSVRASYMDNDPKYLPGDRDYYFNNANRIQIYEFGYHTGKEKLQLDLRPYFMGQRGTYQDWYGLAESQLSWKSSSMRIVGDLNFFTAAHRFSIQTDYGYTYRNTSNRPIAPFHSLRITGNYNNRWFGFNTFIQVNPYYLSDLLASSGNGKYRIYSFGPSSQLDLFDNRLQAQIATMYSYYGFSRSNNFSVTGNARWRMKGGWNLTADLYYTLIRGNLVFGVVTDPQLNENMPYSYAFNNRQLRLGIEKSFGHRGGRRGHKLQLLFFEDRNSNGVRDNDESQARSVLVKIGKEAAVTDDKGRVKFVDMDPGVYNIQVENNRGWVSRDTISVVLTKNRSMEIPLIITRALKGRIKSVTNKYLESRPQLGGIRIVARDLQDKEYSTLTNEDGNYVIYLPIGHYKVDVVTEGMSFSIENPSCEIEVKEGEATEIPDFRYRDERRKVEIKRF
ncbi:MULTISPECIES: MSCRAMM family protein [unclassified Sphingobacterium]|uniref:MSCRAMM family protein n=1 Tax=unclassified Sphingobacterium TaxID=2609468 RepID=UPI0025FFF4BF|nr:MULTISPECIES: carboxypeptidase-like regulatory domain-containing protein [unclassified Sphingobacterium]